MGQRSRALPESGPPRRSRARRRGAAPDGVDRRAVLPSGSSGDCSGRRQTGRRGTRRQTTPDASMKAASSSRRATTTRAIRRRSSSVWRRPARPAPRRPTRTLACALLELVGESSHMEGSAQVAGCYDTQIPCHFASSPHGCARKGGNEAHGTSPSCVRSAKWRLRGTSPGLASEKHVRLFGWNCQKVDHARVAGRVQLKVIHVFG